MPKDVRGKERVDGRRVISGIVHVLRSGCRWCDCPPAPSHPITRGRAGPALLAQVLFSKYGLHLPLNRQSAVYEREGIDLDVSTLADWAGPEESTVPLCTSNT